MQIIWNNDSNFLIKTSTGKRISFDPFNSFKMLSSINYDIITLSQNLTLPIGFNNINKDTKIICDNTTYIEKNVKIKGYLTYSDKLSGLKRGVNYIYTLHTDGIKLCHLGYLGHNLNDELMDNLKYMDFLFVPIGGEMCLDGLEASVLCSKLSPKYIIPMCYNSTGFDFHFNGPKNFLSKAKNLIKLNSNILVTNELPKSAEAITIFLK